MNSDEQPGLDEIEQCFIAVLDERMSRNEAERGGPLGMALGRQ
ncbi:hypothetical protein [Streptosporangium sp. V21-05]